MAAGGVGKEVKGRTHTYYQVISELLIICRFTETKLQEKNSEFLTLRC